MTDDTGSATPGEPRTALLLSGGAPNAPMMAGALLALHERKVKIDLISMTGAGSALGLIYLAPRDMSPELALRNTINHGVSDMIYEMLPVNYKVFQKPGHRAEMFREWVVQNPYLRRMLRQHDMHEGDKLRSDAIQFMLAAMCPSDLSLYSTGLCAHAPFIDHIVDFEKLRQQPIDCVLNAYCIEDKEIHEWRKDEIDVHHFRASLSFPFIYPPYRVDGKHYYEGAAYEPINLTGIGMPSLDDDAEPPADEPPPVYVPPHEAARTRKAGARRHKHLFTPDVHRNDDGRVTRRDRIIVFDIMTKDLIKRPGNLWDAFGQSMILPLVANAQNEEKALQAWQHFGNIFSCLRDVDLKNPKPGEIPVIQAVNEILSHTNPRIMIEHVQAQLPPNVLKVKFQVPDERQGATLEWKASNLNALFEIGVKTGEDFVREHEHELLFHPGGPGPWN